MLRDMEVAERASLKVEFRQVRTYHSAGDMLGCGMLILFLHRELVKLLPLNLFLLLSNHLRSPRYFLRYKAGVMVGISIYVFTRNYQ